jgi:hypothetical protein
MAHKADSSRRTHTNHEPIVESKLCHRCSFLSLYDTTDGFWCEEDDEHYHGPPRLLGPRVHFCSMLPEDEEQDEFYEEIPVDYQHSDELPDLDGLRASAEAGCAFCEALRDAVLTLSLDTPGKVTFDLRYLWYPIEQGGLHFLSVNLDVESEDHESNKREGRILFSVTCQPGKCCSSDLNVQGKL